MPNALTNENRPLYQPMQVAAIIVCAVAIRIYALVHNGLPLFFDEAQYWTWAKDPAMGYFSKPPMVAWLIAATTSVCTDLPFCVRLSAPVLQGITAFVVYFAGCELYDKRTGFWAALLYITLPGVAASSSVISADVPLMLCWALTFLCFAKALDGDGDRWWILAGLCAGLGMLSKYTIVVFFISAAVYMVIHKQHRKFLISAPFILSVLVACFVYFPNFLWNFDNNFVSFAHTNENVMGHKQALHPAKLLEFLGGQLLVFGPITFIVMLLTLRDFRYYGKGKDGKLLLAFTFTLLAIACTIALTSGAQAHWAAPAYITGCILVAHFLLHHKHPRWLKTIFGVHLALALAFLILNPLGKAFGLDPYRRLHMWNGLAAPVAEALLEHPNSVLVSDERKAIGTLMYRLRPKGNLPYPVIKWNPKHTVYDHYDLSTDLNIYKGYNVVFVSRNPDIERFAPYFTSVAPLKQLVLSGQEFHLSHLKDFKGY